MRQAIAREGFDLVQAHEHIPGCDVFRAGDGVHRAWLVRRGRALSALGRLKLKLNPYHHYICRAEARMFADPALKAVICNSRMVADEIQQYFGLPADKLAVIYNGVDAGVSPGLASQRDAVRAHWRIPRKRRCWCMSARALSAKAWPPHWPPSPRWPACICWWWADKHAARYQAQRARWAWRAGDLYRRAKRRQSFTPPPTR